MITSLIFALMTSTYAAPIERVEVLIDAALSPTVGFDDNDNVEVVLHGNLPNACYVLAETTMETDVNKKIIRLRQYAQKKTDGICAEGGNLPDFLKMAVPYTTEVSLGQMKVGDYEFSYKKSNTQLGTRMLSITEAFSPSVDNMPYAITTDVKVKDIVTSKDTVEVKIQGVLNSSCIDLDDHITVTKIDDVFVVLPTIKVRQGMCIQMLRPFEKTIELGKVEAGHYLVHVRSMNGNAVNKIFESIK
jgi:hypothetical protein